MRVCSDAKRKPRYWVESEEYPRKVLYEGNDVSTVLQWAVDHASGIIDVEGTFEGSIVLKGKDVVLKGKDGKSVGLKKCPREVIEK